MSLQNRPVAKAGWTSWSGHEFPSPSRGDDPDLTASYSPLWRGGATGKEFGLAISRSRVQILLEATLRNNLRQVVYTYMPLSPSSITWYRPNGGGALRLQGEVTAGLVESNGSLPLGG